MTLDERLDDAFQIEKAQKLMEYGMGVLIPVFLSLMMFSYILFEPLWPLFMLAASLTAVALILPARKIHELSYRCWTKNTWPRTLVTGAIGMIYITEVSIFAVAMLSMFEGLNPENPLTFVVAAGLVLPLIIVLAYHDKYKDRYEKMDRRLVRLPHQDANVKVSEVLTSSGHHFAVSKNGTGSRIALNSHGVTIDLNPASRSSTAIIMEISDGGDHEVLNRLKTDFAFI